MTGAAKTGWRADRDEWLSGLWSQPALRVTPGAGDGGAREALAGAWAAGPAFAYAKVPTPRVGAVSALEDVGFRAVDVNVTLERTPYGAAAAHVGVDVGEARAEEEPAVLRIAETCFRFSRFHLDPLMPAGLADRVKREWIANYFRRARGEALLVARREGRPAGFLAVLSSTHGGRRVSVIDLIGVAVEEQGRGIGRALVDAFARRGAGRCDLLRVGTQAANIPSIRLYESCGFRMSDTAYVMHAHFQRPLTA